MDTVLIIDGNCDFCRGTSRAMKEHLGLGGTIIPWSPEVGSTYGVSEEEAENSVWFVADGQRWPGAAGVARWLETGGTVTREAGRIMELPGIDAIADAGYRWISAHRDKLARFSPRP